MSRKNTVNLAALGILPDTGEDYTNQLNRLFEECGDDTEFVFAKGVYRFHSTNGTKKYYFLSNFDMNPPRILSLLLQNKKHITVEGNGSSFLFYGYLMPITVDGCTDVVLRGFSIDWEFPLVSEGIVVDRDTDYVDLQIDQNLYPCFAKNFNLYFDIGDREVSEITFGGHMMYDQYSNRICPTTTDTLLIRSVDQIDDEIFRLYIAGILADNQYPYIGNILLLKHNRHIHAGIFAQDTDGILCEEITVHSTGGDGILFQYCRDVTCRHVDMLPNRALGRLIASVRDFGIHIVDSGGSVEIENCAFQGVQDDPVNLHGTGLWVRKIADANTIIARYSRSGIGISGYLYWAAPGDTVRILRRDSMATVTTLTVASCERYDDEYFRIVFREPIPESVTALPVKQLALENADNTPSVRIRSCYFGSCRARGIFVNTPKKVLIEDNVFESSGAAILIAGDTSYWNITSPCLDVEIRNNIFTDACFNSYFEYSKAVISVCPEISAPSAETPFHKNIRIHGNTFLSPDTPVLYAFSADGVRFTDNRILRCDRVSNPLPGESLIRFEYCTDAEVSGNSVTGVFGRPFLSGSHTIYKNGKKS